MDTGWVMGMISGGVSIMVALLACLFAIAMLWLRVNTMWRMSIDHPPLLLAEKVDTLWEYVVVAALERSRLVDHHSAYAPKPEALGLLTSEIELAIAQVKSSDNNRRRSIAELTFMIQRRVGVEHLATVARENGVSIHDMLGLLAALAEKEIKL